MNQHGVILLGESRLRKRAIAAIRNCEANIYQIEELTTLPILTASACCSVAVVCLGEVALPDSALLQSIHDLFQCGLTVLACGDRVAEWSLAEKCLPLLA